MVDRGVAFRTAHQIVGRLVLQCEQQKIAALGELDVDRINDACESVGVGRPADRGVFEWLGARNVVDRYCSFGNAGLGGFEQQIESWKQRLQTTS